MPPADALELGMPTPVAPAPTPRTGEAGEIPRVLLALLYSSICEAFKAGVWIGLDWLSLGREPVVGAAVDVVKVASRVEVRKDEGAEDEVDGSISFAGRG
jgi:hypothetical protein